MYKRRPLHELLPLESPIVLLIDPCDICNFKCSFCFQNYVQYKGQLMEFDLYKKVINDLKEFKQPVKVINLYGFGEPLINPRLSEYIRYAKDVLGKEQKISITTNGSLMSAKIAQDLYEAGVDEVIFSIYAVDDEMYKTFTKKTNITVEKIVENVKIMYKVSHNNPDKKCYVITKINGGFLTEDQRKKFVKTFQGISDECIVDRIINNWPGADIYSDMESKMTCTIDRIEEWRVCPQPFYQMVVHSNGKVSPCCVEYGQELVVGDVTKESMREIWHGKKWNELRRKILSEEQPAAPVCATCDYSKYGATENITPYKEELLKLYQLQ